jgi:hypothetical protein
VVVFATRNLENSVRGTLATSIGILIERQAVRVLVLAVADSIVVTLTKAAGGTLLHGADLEVAGASLLCVGGVAAAVALAVRLAAGLATLGVDAHAIVVLGLAGVGTRAGALGPHVGVAVGAVGVCVQLQDVAGFPVCL